MEKNLIRTNIYLTKPQHRKLKKLAATKGISLAELVRRILDALLDKGNFGDGQGF